MHGDLRGAARNLGIREPAPAGSNVRIVAGAPQDPQYEELMRLRDENAADAAAAAAAAGSPAPGPGHRPASRTARARAQAEQLRHRADETVKDLEAKRPANRWIDAAFSTFERDVSSGGGVLAAALAFRLFIFMVPFVFVIITAFPFIADSMNSDPQEVASNFGMAGLVATAINSADNLSFWSRLSLLVGGAIALVLASRSLVRVLRITHGLAWHARVPKLQKPTRAALVLIGAVLGIVLFGAWTSKLQDRVGVIGLIPMLLAGVVLAGMWTFIQYHLPRADVPWTKLIPGSVLVALGVEGLQLVTVVWFTRYIENKSETYGAIGAALAILLWAYFLGRIVVSGAMLNAALYEQEHRHPPEGAPPGQPEAPTGQPEGRPGH
jgi:uncharacterized BrkB/YihY/UPF0761 family membrane protein